VALNGAGPEGGIVEVNDRVQRIRRWQLARERPPAMETPMIPFSKLAIIVNGMLDEMETLIHSLAGVGPRHRA